MPGARKTKQSVQFLVEKLVKRSKNETNEPLDMKGKYDAYMFGLGGPKSENVEKPLVLKVFLGGQRGKNIPRVEKS